MRYIGFNKVYNNPMGEFLIENYKVYEISKKSS